jgi:hypothetical protein
MLNTDKNKKQEVKSRFLSGKKQFLKAGFLFCILNSAFCICSYAQSWNLTGNAGTNASSNFLGTTDNVSFKIRTKNVLRINVTNTGKVGIGNFSPVFKLDVKGGSINTDSVYRIKGNAVVSVDPNGTSNNIFVGYRIGLFCTNLGDNNTAMGADAFVNDSLGGENVAIGNQA